MTMEGHGRPRRARPRLRTRIIVADFDAGRAGDSVRALREAGITAEPFTVDVTDEAQTAALGRFAVDTFGRVDILLNNAAFMEPITQPLLDIRSSLCAARSTSIWSARSTASAASCP
jgi:NAD(P)-dependent dehydrogenase (short-subunit alcohol dehydrogenase family)